MFLCMCGHLHTCERQEDNAGFGPCQPPCLKHGFFFDVVYARLAGQWLPVTLCLYLGRGFITASVIKNTLGDQMLGKTWGGGGLFV